MNTTQRRNKAHFDALAIAEANRDKIKVYDNTHSGYTYVAPKPKRLSNGRGGK